MKKGAPKLDEVYVNRQTSDVRREI